MSHSILKSPEHLAITYFLSVSTISFIVFAWDKYSAQKGRWRIRERTILFLASIGGSIAIVACQKILRHKTRKQPFAGRLRTILFLQIAMVIALVFLTYRQLDIIAMLSTLNHIG